jgi:hypothetical protein
MSLLLDHDSCHHLDQVTNRTEGRFIEGLLVEEGLSHLCGLEDHLIDERSQSLLASTLGESLSQ